MACSTSPEEQNRKEHRRGIAGEVASPVASRLSSLYGRTGSGDATPVEWIVPTPSPVLLISGLLADGSSTVRKIESFGVH